MSRRAFRFGRMTAGLTVSLSLAIGSFSPSLAEAAAVPYDISIISLNAPQRLAPGAQATVTVNVKNIGTATWSNTSKNFVSIYSYDNIRRVEVNSVLASPGWENAMRPVRLPVASLAPGGVTTFSFPLVAPSKPGIYKSDFLFVAEGLRRMANGRFSLNIEVGTNTLTSAPTAAPVVASVPPPAPPSLGGVNPEPVADNPDWRAELLSMGGSEWQINMEENIFVTLAFKNAGKQAWKKDGPSYVSVYAVTGNKERTSQFRDLSWNKSQAAKMVESLVKPVETGHFKVELRAPRAPGAYREEFMLASEDTAWISGSRVILPIRVPLTGDFIATAPPGQSVAEILGQSSASHGGTYTANLLLRSLQSMTVSGNGRQQVTVGFKNTGNVAWNTRGIKIKSVVPALSGTLGSVRDDSWNDIATAVQVMGVTNPGEVGFLTFYVKAPPKKGTYTASFQLVADSQQVDGGVMDIPITVTADGYIAPEPVPAPSNSTNPAPSSIPALNPIPLTGDVSSLPNEPIIRVGIFATTNDQMMVTARFVPLEVRNGGSVVCVLPVGKTVTVSYDRGGRMYRMSGDCPAAQSSVWYVVRAQDGISPMEMSDFSRLVSWLPGANDNTFRDQLELRVSQNGSEVWVINELPIEWYLKGIGETSNSSPQQYQRALLTAARTYAMYHVQRGTKHAAQNFTVDATYDQVYRGYGAELRDPNVITAIDATRGQIVTYQGKLAITPYYSRSDGRTRSWTEVWGGGAVPWRVSVPVPDDIGRTLWGHGVGMSAMGALQMDAKHGNTYDQILAHFYTGTELRRAYK